MTARNKARGYELEAETRDFWVAAGFDCRRTLASGAYKQTLGDDHAGDLRLEDLTVEAKRKKTGFKFLYDAIAQDDADLLVVRQDRHPRVYIITEATLLALMTKAYK